MTRTRPEPPPAEAPPAVGAATEPGRLPFFLLLFLLTFAPLAFGTVEHWSKTIAQLTVAVALVWCVVDLHRAGEPLLRVPGLLPLLLLLGLLVVQVVPLPVPLLQLLSPRSWEAYRPVAEAAGGLGWLPLSVHPKATVQEFFRLGAGVLLYVLAIQVLRSGARVKRVLGWVVALGGGIAFVAILQQFSAGGTIYWLRPAPGGNPGGPWVNVNQYAAFVEAICPLALALLLFNRTPVGVRLSWRERVVSFFSSSRSSYQLFLGFVFILLASSVFTSLSRGGIVTILLSMILFAALKAIVQRRTGRTAVWVIFCLVLLAVTWFGWQPIIDEFAKGLGADWTIRDARTTLYGDTLAIIKDFPLFGAGFGTFVDVYPSYQTIEIDRVFDHAHNDYLELLTSGGGVGLALAAWFLLTLLHHGWRMVRRRRDRFAVLAGIGALTSIGALLMHSLVDFNLQNPAIGLYFFFVCGLLVAAVNTRYSYHETRSLLPERGKRSLAGLALLSIGFLVVTALTQFGVMKAGHRFNQVKSIYVSSHLGPVLMTTVAAGVQTARRWDPLESYYPYYHGNLAVLREGRDEAANHYLRAASLRPLEGIYLQRLALLLPAEQRQEATRLMAEGYRRATVKSAMIGSWVEWLLLTGQRAEAVDLMAEGLVRGGGQAATLMALMEVYRFSREEAGRALPPSVEAWIRFGRYLEEMGQVEEAGYYRGEALRLIYREEGIKPQWFAQLIDYHQRHQQTDAALSVLRRAVQACPDHAPFRVQLGDYYRTEQIWYRALEEYQKAAALEPGNESYRRRVRKLQLDLEYGR